MHPGLSAKGAYRIAGITYREGHYWRRCGIVKPSDVTPGKHARYSLRDVIALRVVRDLRAAELPLQRVRRAVEKLRREPEGWPPTARLLTDGREVWIAPTDQDLIALLGRPGQVTMRAVLDLGGIAREVRAAVAREARAA